MSSLLITCRYRSTNNKTIKVTFVLFSFFTQTLIQQGRCNINALGRNSATPLHLAAEMDNADICKILVSQSALKLGIACNAHG